MAEPYLLATTMIGPVVPRPPANTENRPRPAQREPEQQPTTT
ncbi:hypothetical protein ACH4GK_20890 [Streptomyces rimosus]|nr:hypothetical protein [Streptomyces rimosus]